MLTHLARTVACRWWRPVLRWVGLADGLHAMFCPSCDQETEEEDAWWRSTESPATA